MSERDGRDGAGGFLCCSPTFWGLWLGVLLVACGGLMLLAEVADLRLEAGVAPLAAAGLACLATAARFRTPHCFVMGPALLLAALALQLDRAGHGLSWELVGPGLLIAFGGAMLFEGWVRTRRSA